MLSGRIVDPLQVGHLSSHAPCCVFVPEASSLVTNAPAIV